MRGRHLLLGTRGGSPLGPRGVVLVITLLLVGLLFVMATTMINLASSDYQVANNESQSIQALFNADAGVEEAKMRVSPNAPTGMGVPIGTDPRWRVYLLSGTTQTQIQGGLDATYNASEATGNYSYYNTVQTGSNTIQWGWARIQHKFDGGGNILYQDVTTGADTTTASWVDGGGTTIYNPPILIVTAEGIQGSVRRQISAEYQPIVSTTTTTNRVVTDPFGNAIHGKSTIFITGNARTDSYDSRIGPYGGTNVHHKGDVSTDSVLPQEIKVNTNSTVDGKAAVGPASLGGDPATGIDNKGDITGTTTTEPSLWNLPLSTIPAGVTNQGPLTIAGNTTKVLNEGTYWFSSISITGNAQLKIQGAVKIFVTGNILINGNGTGNAAPVLTKFSKAENLLIYGTVDPNNSSNKCTQVQIQGNGDLYSAVYAPAASIMVSGNGNVYGSLSGNTVTVNGSHGANFHYDEALANLGESVTTSSVTTYATTGYSRYSWHEIAF
ncbi:MAG TPA: hypothetical protein VEH53_06885 [archaeon]|nr:hypothetical protein [archaeon]